MIDCGCGLSLSRQCGLHGGDHPSPEKASEREASTQDTPVPVVKGSEQIEPNS